MTYEQFIENITFGNTTVLFYGSSNKLYGCASGTIINENIFENITTETEFNIAEINKFPSLKKSILENCLTDLVSDKHSKNYKALKTAIKSGNAKIGYWDEDIHDDLEPLRTYMLILN